MARRSARILAKELAKARKHQVSGPNSSHMFSGNGNSSLEQFPLMELPREVRDMIYEACLSFDGAIFVRDKGFRSTIEFSFRPREREDFDGRMSSIEPSATAQGRNLFYVSKRIHDEAFPIFYRKNTFEFISLIEMGGFIRNIRLKNRHNLRSVIVYYEGSEYERPLRLLARCVGLRDLTLVLCDGYQRYLAYHDGILTFDRAWVQGPRAFKTLLKIRGLDRVKLLLGGSADYNTRSTYFKDVQAMEAAIQVMKQPRSVPQERTKRNKVKKRAQKKRKSTST